MAASVSSPRASEAADSPGETVAVSSWLDAALARFVRDASFGPLDPPIPERLWRALARRGLARRIELGRIRCWTLTPQGRARAERTLAAGPPEGPGK